MLNILSILDILTEDIAFLKSYPFNSFLAQDTTQEIIRVSRVGHPQMSSHVIADIASHFLLELMAWKSNSSP